ncbi:MAG: metallophosphoesterase [Candidatus Aminicenantes bacterium]|nr:metallophosphoesterase [Candidatus Aminicenantes bacterium]
MKHKKTIKKEVAFPLLILFVLTCFSCVSHKDRFSFVFLTDMHVQPELHAKEGFQQAVQVVNELKPDFVLTGGDLIMDANSQSFERADELYILYRNISEQLEMPVYNTMGNHEIFGVGRHSDVDPSHPEFGEKMYQNRIGKLYYSFDYKGWHFMVLDSVEFTPDHQCVGRIDPQQMEWIQQDLQSVAPETPIVISTHIPLVSAYPVFVGNPVRSGSSSIVVNNGPQVLQLFKEHNLKLVLQGHLHWIEDISIGGIRFITNGAVSANWWEGPRDGLQEGFGHIKVKGDSVEWEYIDFQWDHAQFDHKEKQ